jgi:uncharacterized protein
MSNVETVQTIYAASSSGDIQTILSLLRDDIEWEYDAPESDVPWLKPRRGRADVAQFFEALTLLDLNMFTPKHFVADGALVLVLVDEDVLVKATGKRIVDVDQVHLWHFDASGLVARFRQRLDTHAHWTAFHAAPLLGRNDRRC